MLRLDFGQFHLRLRPRQLGLEVLQRDFSDKAVGTRGRVLLFVGDMDEKSFMCRPHAIAALADQSFQMRVFGTGIGIFIPSSQVRSTLVDNPEPDSIGLDCL